MEPIVEVESGPLRGVATAGGAVRAFKDIPYAKPPLGALRWRPPEPVPPWAGVRVADQYGPRCVQPSRPINSISYFGPETDSEDCLFLNVWTGSAAGAKQPVIVWFHGGAYRLGSGSIPLFDGTGLAQQGAVVVTVNYRLGKLGFLAHPELTRESAHGASGNYGMLDQRAALQWVQRNIAAFGGDPGCVTIVGQSAGSTSVCLHMSSPLSAGLFHRVIGQSGAAFGPISPTSGIGDVLQRLEDAEQTGLVFARSVGASSLAELRALPPETIQLGLPSARGDFDSSKMPRGLFDSGWPIVDGYFLPDSPIALFSRGQQNDVPLLTGSNLNEGAILPWVGSVGALGAFAKEDFGAAADDLLELYSAQNDAEAREASSSVFADRSFTWQNWTWAKLHSRTGKAPTYYYRFNYAPPMVSRTGYCENEIGKFGAFHCAEIPYIFRNLQVRDWPWGAADRRLVEVMSSYWLNFALTGDPNGTALPAWPVFDERKPTVMVITDTQKPGEIHDQARMEFWDRFYGV